MGPSRRNPVMAIGAAGPTTSGRMDAYPETNGGRTSGMMERATVLR